MKNNQTNSTYEFDRDNNQVNPKGWNIIKTINAGDKLNTVEALFRKGKALFNRLQFNNAIISGVIADCSINIQLTKDLIVKRDEYDDIFYMVEFKNEEIFRFTSINTNAKLDGYKLEFIFYDGLNIVSENLADFSDEDVEYLLKNFPYYLYMIKYVMSFFLTNLMDALNMRYNVDHKRLNDNTIFLNDPIHNADRKMCELLKDIHASKLHGYFNTKSNMYKPQDDPYYNDQNLLIKRKINF